MTQEDALILVETSTSASVLLGVDPRKTYRDLAKLIHPDHVSKSLKSRADAAFAKLQAFYEGSQGKPNRVKFAEWEVTPFAKGSLCDLYSDNVTVLKIVRSQDDNDLMEAEAQSLGILQADKRSNKYKHYVPVIQKSFRASDRCTNVINHVAGYYSLADIKALYWNGIDFRHIVWMINRLLTTLGFVHNNGLVHGAILPEHLLYHPTTHGLVLIDWCYSVKINQPVTAIVSDYALRYPQEVLKKRFACPGTDIYMASWIVDYADHIPDRFKPLLTWMRAEGPLSRPQDAWELLDRWKKLAVEEFGDPQYLKLEIPKF